ncbi:tRNA adenylyltransferase, partial [Candidatus Bathyarchaeota archaeon]
MKNSISNDLRQKAAREAALLLYTQQEKEYKQAKVRATKSLGINFLPNNREIAEQLDLLAEEVEGEERKRRLIEMRH